MTETWIAEDVPAYLIFKEERRPMTDYDAAMSARHIIAKAADRTAAARAMADHLHSTANIRHVQLGGESDMYRAAAEMFEASGSTRSDTAPMLRIWGRVYRIRKES
jgi:hypothetical protein